MNALCVALGTEYGVRGDGVVYRDRSVLYTGYLVRGTRCTDQEIHFYIYITNSEYVSIYFLGRGNANIVIVVKPWVCARVTHSPLFVKLCVTLIIFNRRKIMAGLFNRLSKGLRQTDTSVGKAARKLGGRQAQIDAAVAKATGEANTAPPKKKKFKSFQKARF